MSNEQIIEGGKLIAQFMGYPEDEIQAEEWCGCNVLQECAFTGEKTMVPANYHSSWDWLMPVVDKIEAIRAIDAYWESFTVQVGRKYCIIKCHERNRQDGVVYQTPYGFEPESKIEAVWLAVVEFMKWSNPPKSPSHV